MAPQSRLDEIQRDIKELKAYVLGSPELDGIATRVKIIEETERRRSFMLRTMFAAVVTLILNALRDLFKA